MHATYLAGAGLAHQSGQLPRSNVSGDTIQQFPLAILDRDDVGQILEGERVLGGGRLGHRFPCLILILTVFLDRGTVTTRASLLVHSNRAGADRLGAALEERDRGLARRGSVDLGGSQICTDEANSECNDDAEILPNKLTCQPQDLIGLCRYLRATGPCSSTRTTD